MTLRHCDRTEAALAVPNLSEAWVVSLGKRLDFLERLRVRLERRRANDA